MSTTNGGPAPQPGAPQMPGPQQPSIKINIGVEAAPLAENDVEVVLRLDGKAEVQGSVLFGFELLYAGVFRVLNIPPESLQPMIMIECPRLLFPFAREIVATATRNGGFPPLMLEPVDFASLYRQRMAAAQPAAPPPLNLS